MRPLIIDTNFWLLPFERRIDIFAQLERLIDEEPFHILLPSPVFNELKAMANAAPNLKNTRAAKAALGVIEGLRKSGRLTDYPIDGPADGAIITSALQKGAWVATSDKGLRGRLKYKKIRTIIVRDEHMLMFE